MLVTFWGALGIYDGYIGIWLMAVAGELERNPSAVGRPYIVESSVAFRICRTVGKPAHLSGGHIHYHQLVTVLNKCKALAVGRILRICALDVVAE